MQLPDDFKYIIYIQKLLYYKWNLLLSSTATNVQTDWMLQLSEVRKQLQRFDKKINELEQKLQSISKVTNETLSELQRLKRDMETCQVQMNRLEEDKDTNEGAIIIVGSNVEPKTRHKAHLSNNIIRIVRGPIKTMIHETMLAIDVYGQELRPIELIQQAVHSGFERQTRNRVKHRNKKTVLKPTFTQVTSDWKFEGENLDQGLSSISIWMRDPQGQRVLVKTEDHPLSAANEWFAYVLGRTIGLPINIVQIALYQDQLVTLHVDVTHEDEKTFTFMDLPKKKRKLLLHEPLLVRMEVFDHILQNTDRNQRNILITIPKTIDINEDPIRMKIHFVDHGASFGMHKLNAISIVASKLHFNRIGVISFEPEEQAHKFEQYLNKFSIVDRPLIIDILIRFAAISDKQLQKWMNSITDLLSISQSNRIYEVLRLKRNVAQRCLIQWNLTQEHDRSRSEPLKRKTSETSVITTYL